MDTECVGGGRDLITVACVVVFGVFLPEDHEPMQPHLASDTSLVSCQRRRDVGQSFPNKLAEITS